MRLITLHCYLFADGRIFSRDDLSGMALRPGFGRMQFHNFNKLLGNSLMTAVKL